MLFRSVVALGRSKAFGRVLHAAASVAANRLSGRREQLDLLARLVEKARAFDARVSDRILREPRAVANDLRALIGER